MLSIESRDPGGEDVSLEISFPLADTEEEAATDIAFPKKLKISISSGHMGWIYNLLFPCKDAYLLLKARERARDRQSWSDRPWKNK